MTEDKDVDAHFMYTVKWRETNIPFENRMDKYSQSSSLPHHLEIHWFSIINSLCHSSHFDGFSCNNSHASLEERFHEVRFCMPKMRKQPMTKKTQDRSTFMVMFSGFPSTNCCLLLPMVLEPSCSPSQCSFLCLHWSLYFIHTTEELCSLLLWSYTHSHLALRDILQPLSTVSLKGQIGSEIYYFFVGLCS